MKRLACLLAALLIPLAALGQEDDRSFLVGLIEDNLSGVSRTVRLEGFEGALSSEAALTRLTIADDQGVWLTLEDARLNWDRAALLRGRLDITSLTAGRIALDRLPQADESVTEAAEASGFALPDLPVSVEIGELRADRIELGAPVLGTPAALALDGAVSLAGGAGTVALTAERIDGTRGRFVVDAGFSNADQVLALNLELDEGPQGIAVSLLNLPGAPPIALTIAGTGPLTDYAADIALASDGVERVTGAVTLLGQTLGEAPDAPVQQNFSARLNGDITSLVAPAFRDFFGPRISLEIAGSQAPGGALTLETLALRAAEVTLTGSAAFNPDFWPERLALDGRIGSVSGLPVRLPVSGAETTITQAELDVRYDQADGESWTGAAVVMGLTRPEGRVSRLSLTGGGVVTQGDALTIGRIASALDFRARGLAPADPALAEALGADLDGLISFSIIEDQPIRVPRLQLTGAGLDADASLVIDGLESGFDTALDLRAEVADLSRFGPLVGQPLQGAALGTVAGQVAPLAGTFDLRIDLTGQDLGLGQDAVDRLIAGTSTLGLRARRDTEGAVLEDVVLDGTALSGSGRLQLSAEASRADFTATLSDVALVAPQFSGPLRAQVQAEGDVNRWQIAAEATGPGATRASIDGVVGVDGQSADLQLALEEQDLALGIGTLDRLIAGRTRLSTRLLQEGETVRLEDLVLEGSELSGTGAVTLTPETSTVTGQARLRNVGLFAPEFSGPLDITGQAEGTGGTWQVDASGTGPGGTQAQVAGQVLPEGRLALDIDGRGPLGLINGLIAPRNIQGIAAFDLRAEGAPGLDALSGIVSTSGARLATPVLRAALEDISANIRLNRGTAEVDVAGAVASGGRIGLSGPLGLAAPFSSDLRATLRDLTLTDPTLYETSIDGDLTLRGPLTGGAQITGDIRLGPTEVQVPSTTITTLGDLPEIIHVDEPAAVRATRGRAGLLDPANGNGGATGPAYGLDIDVRAPERIFIRGRGLDAELGGGLRLRGTTARVIPSGRFELLRGRLDILQQRFDLTEGWAQLQGDFDPELRLVAATETDTVEARVVVAGPASAPEVSFESTPELPEDEILAQIFFGRDLASLSAFQALQLASAVATLAGRGGEGLVSRLRQGTGLDDLDVTTDEEGNAAVRAGKYLSDNVYTDVTVGAAGEAEINLNLDITSTVTAKGTLQDDGSSSLGIFFERDY